MLNIAECFVEILRVHSERIKPLESFNIFCYWLIAETFSLLAMKIIIIFHLFLVSYFILLESLSPKLSTLGIFHRDIDLIQFENVLLTKGNYNKKSSGIKSFSKYRLIYKKIQTHPDIIKKSE